MLRLHLNDEYDSALKDSNHSGNDEIPSNAIELLIKILFIPHDRKLLATKECLPFLFQTLQEVDTEVKHISGSTLDINPKYIK